MPVTNLKGNFLLSQDPVLHVFVFTVLPCPFLLELAMDRRGIYVYVLRFLCTVAVLGFRSVISAVAFELNAILCNV